MEAKVEVSAFLKSRSPQKYYRLVWFWSSMKYFKKTSQPLQLQCRMVAQVAVIQSRIFHWPYIQAEDLSDFGDQPRLLVKPPTRHTVHTNDQRSPSSTGLHLLFGFGFPPVKAGPRPSKEAPVGVPDSTKSSLITVTKTSNSATSFGKLLFPMVPHPWS